MPPDGPRSGRVARRVLGGVVLVVGLWFGLRHFSPRPEVSVRYHAPAGDLEVVVRSEDGVPLTRAFFAAGSERIHAPPLAVGPHSAELRVAGTQRVVPFEVPGPGGVEVYWKP
jgi:hypothetical protein